MWCPPSPACGARAGRGGWGGGGQSILLSGHLQPLQKEGAWPIGAPASPTRARPGSPPWCCGGIWPRYRISPRPPPPPWHAGPGTGPGGAGTRGWEGASLACPPAPGPLPAPSLRHLASWTWDMGSDPSPARGSEDGTGRELLVSHRAGSPVRSDPGHPVRGVPPWETPQPHPHPRPPGRAHLQGAEGQAARLQRGDALGQVAGLLGLALLQLLIPALLGLGQHQALDGWTDRQSPVSRGQKGEARTPSSHWHWA